MAAPRRRAAPRKAPPEPQDERRARILAAACREFGRHGFAAASTNAIADEAGVAKGLLFHHYGSKEALFTAAFDDVVERTLARLFTEAEPLPADLFERLAALSVRKLAFFGEDPDAYRLVWTTVTALSEPFRQELLARQKARTGAHWARVLEGVDTTRLRPGLSLADAVETISLVLDGFERLAMEARSPRRGRSAPLPALHERLLTHLGRLREGLYG